MFNTKKFNEAQFNTTSVSEDVPLCAIYIFCFVPSVPVPCVIQVEVCSIILTTYAPTLNVTLTAPLCTITLSTYAPVLHMGTKHAARDAVYTESPREINRIYVVGRDRDGNFVYGEAKNQTNIDLYGEMLRIHVDTTITTTEYAVDIAAAMLEKVRLESPRGTILIPPNIGMEMWDVIAVTDTVCHKTVAKYRVSGYQLEYENLAGKFEHTVSLAEV
jgi:hypothetical protein